MATSRRGPLHFESLGEILDDAQRVGASPHRTVGQWSAGQVIDHLANFIEMSVHGFGIRPAAWPIRAVAWLARPLILRRTVPAGLKFPDFARQALAPRDVGVDAALDRMRQAIADAHARGMTQPSPFLGRLNCEQWRRLHCRHAELHLSFIVPSDDARDQAQASVPNPDLMGY